MSGKVPPSSRATSKTSRMSASKSSDVRRAAKLYERFTGHDAEGIATVTVPPHPKAVAIIGELDAVEYTTVRDGKVEAYRHEFAAKDKPLLCSSPDGRQLLIIGDRFDFTARGIVDASDKRFSPRKR